MTPTEQTVPCHVPEGMTHLEYLLGEALAAFRKGQRNDGLIHLAQAVHVAATKGEGMDPLESGQWFAEITRASGAWDVDA